MFVLLRPIRLFLRAMLTGSTPSQMSLGLACGVLLGLIPKGNLLAISLALLIAATRANLGVVAAAATICTYLAHWIDPLSDRVGRFVLTLPSLQGFWTDVYNTPGMPWTNFNDSVVMGGFLIGLLLIGPLYFLTQSVFAEYMDIFAERAKTWRLTRLMLGAEWADRLGSVD